MAGLLDHRPATTHWGWTADLAERFPLIDVRPEVLYVDDGNLITSAGVASGIDCCLHLLRRLKGAEAAARVARMMVVPPHRQGNQAQFVDVALRNDGYGGRFAQNLEWLRQHLSQPHSIDTLAEHFMMSRRTFTRRFRSITGSTVGVWLLHQRLALAQRLLETTGRSIDLIAQESGFGSEALLRFHFNKELRTTPSRYRREFRGQST
jgi:transcriptional regulator GlxA family with amidase domain